MFYQVRFPIVRILNGGRVNQFSIGACSMSYENGDRVALRKAWLIASIAALQGQRSSGEFESLSVYSHEREWSR